MKSTKKAKKVNFIQEIVDNYKTKHERGFNAEEMIDLLKYFPDITIEQFGEALGVRTVMTIDNVSLTYKSDVELALNCIVHKRKPSIYEFD